MVKFIKYHKYLVVYITTAVVGVLSYLPVKTLFITQEASPLVTESTLTVNMLLLFMAWGASCPIISKKLGKPRYWGYIMLTPVLLILVFFMSLFGAQPRW